MNVLTPNPYPGLFIVFEGLDGSGESTQAEMLAKALKAEFGGRRVWLTKEPSESSVGGTIRDSLQGIYRLSPTALQFMFIADRFIHLTKEGSGIVPRLERGDLVVNDRYHFSTMSFGSIPADLDDEEEQLVRLHSYGELLVLLNQRFGLIWPDLTFILRVPSKVCVQRIAESRGHVELFEEEKKLTAVWRAYEYLHRSYRDAGVYLLDGERPIEAIAEEVLATVKTHSKFRAVSNLLP
jgi:dTMP kinase